MSEELANVDVEQNTRLVRVEDDVKELKDGFKEHLVECSDSNKELREEIHNSNKELKEKIHNSNKELGEEIHTSNKELGQEIHNIKFYGLCFLIIIVFITIGSENQKVQSLINLIF